MKRASLFVSGLAGAAAASIAHSATAAGSVYCTAGKPALEFAGRIEPDGRLFFGLSVWDARGNNSFVYGRADRIGDHWLYVRKDGDNNTLETPCRLEVWYSQRGGVRAEADPQTGCANHGGWNEVTLASQSYQGPVTVELDAPSNFFEDPPALLGKGDCFKQNPG